MEWRAALVRSRLNVWSLSEESLRLQKLGECYLSEKGVSAFRMAPVTSPAISEGTREQILGIRFLQGTPAEAVAEMLVNGGLLVAPSGTCFVRLIEDQDYRRAITSADLVLPDSGLMVALWRLLRARSINRISGLAYLKQLLANSEVGRGNRTCWVLPNERARDKLLSWSEAQDYEVASDGCYIAPIYDEGVHDESLLRLLEAGRPFHVVIAIGAGAQEKLGSFLRERLPYRPAIHCIGGALGFLTGDQTAIPDWADRFYLGWFLRLLCQPRAFVPRLWKARVLPGIILKYGERLPPLKMR